MLYATNIFPGDNTTTQFELTFVGGYLDRDHVVAYIEDNLSKVQTPIDMGTVTWLGPYTIRLSAPAPIGQNVVVARQTPREPLVDFQGSSRITEANLDLAHRQGLFVAVESLDSANSEVVNQLKDVIIGVQEVADDALLSAAAAESSATSAAGAAGIAAGQASQAMSSATAAQGQANAASGFAADALLHRNAAEGFKNDAAGSVADVAASAASALASRDTAAGHASAALGSANTAASRASAALASQNAAALSEASASSTASTASTHASNASASATAAAGSATSASASASTANSASNLAATAASTAQLAVREALRQCCRLVRTGVALQVKLERFGGTSMRINNAIATIPEAGATVTLVNTGTLTHVYAYLNAGVVALTANTTSPVWHPASGEWVYPGLPEYLFVGAVVPNAMTQPGKFRSVFNGGSVTTNATGMTTVTGNWNGGSTILSTVTYIQMPGDTILLKGQTLWLNNYPGSCISDIVLRDSGAILMRERASLAQAMWGTASNIDVLRVPDTSIPYFAWSEVIFVATNNVGNTWTVEGGLGHHNVTCIPTK